MEQERNKTSVISFNTDVDKYRAILDKMAQKYKEKNHDYGNSFGEVVQDLGPLVGFGQIYHKCNRAKNLLKGAEPQVKDESIRDTLIDMANYCVLLAMEMDKITDNSNRNKDE